MVERRTYFGTTGPFIYDDTDLIADEDGYFTDEYYGSMVSTHQGYIEEDPTEDRHICLLNTLGERISRAITVTDISDPSELNLLESENGGLIACYQTRTGLPDFWTLYLWDETVPVTFDSPYLVEGSDGVWIAVTGCYSYFTGQTSGGSIVCHNDEVVCHNDEVVVW